MTVLEFLAKLTGRAPGELVKFLERAAEAAPDLAPTAQEWIGKLNDAVGPEALVALGKDVLDELGQIGRGELNPKDHPSDAA